MVGVENIFSTRCVPAAVAISGRCLPTKASGSLYVVDEGTNFIDENSIV